MESRTSCRREAVACKLVARSLRSEVRLANPSEEIVSARG